MSNPKTLFVRANNTVRSIELPDTRLSSETLEPHVYKAIAYGFKEPVGKHTEEI